MSKPTLHATFYDSLINIFLPITIFSTDIPYVLATVAQTISSLLEKHNKTTNTNTLNSKRRNQDDEILCNCRQRQNCPTDGKCLTKSVVYKAEVTSTDDNARQT